MSAERLREAADRLESRDLHQYCQTYPHMGECSLMRLDRKVLTPEAREVAALLRKAMSWRHVREWGQCVPYCPLCSALDLADAILGGTE